MTKSQNTNVTIQNMTFRPLVNKRGDKYQRKSGHHAGQIIYAWYEKYTGQQKVTK